jgi:DNA polymerase-4
MGQLRKADPQVLATVLGKRAAHYQALARGEDEREVMAETAERSISREVTFDKDLLEARALRSELQRQAESVGERLRAHGLLTRTIQIKVRDQRFRTITRSRSLAAPTASNTVIFRQARDLLDKWLTENPKTPVRLLGVGLSSLQSPDKQSGLYESAQQTAIDRTMDAVKQRYGDNKLTHALALKDGKKH